MLIPPPHPATLPDEDPLKQCEISFGRGSGPGGQHRNKVETGATITHVPTGVVARATERREQSVNRKVALRRLRLKLANEIRTRIDRERYRPSDLWRSRRQGEKMSINPAHADYPALLAEAMDIVVARKFDVAGAAGLLGITMSQLAKLLRHDRPAFAKVNAGRVERGLPALK
jgi:hypothetical protein